MKRTSYPVSRDQRAKSTTSSSFVPPITTQLILIGVSPAASAARIPASTFSSASRRVISANRWRRSESHEIVARSMPASASGAGQPVEQHAVRGQRDVEVGTDLAEHPDQDGEVRADRAARRR